MKNKSKGFINFILLASVIIATFLILESFIENYLITKAPVKFHFALPAGLAVLAQSSKTERIPKDYIAIAGDSYAQGKGDWLLEIDPDTNAAFHSAHALQKLTGRDVISFGKSGASNIKGWVREPIARYRFIHDKIDSSIAPPQIILAYFYAGNDLLENVLQLRESFIPTYTEAAINDPAAWDDYFISAIDARKVGPFSGVNNNIGWLPRASFKILKQEFKTKKVGEELGDIHIVPTGKVNSVWVNNNEIKIPDLLQSPAIELNHDETELGFLALTNSLHYLKNYFSQSKIIVVYIPSVIESYAKVSEKISISNIIAEDSNKVEEIHAASALTQRSNEIADRVKKISQAMGLNFIDTRPAIQKASKKQIIHGPIDWKHYNRKGYETLAQSIVCALEDQAVLATTNCPKN